MATFDYYYGEESEQFSFYRIPRMLITGSQFKNLSTDAKLLYGLMLDRMNLSRKNGWLDNCGRVYIFYPLNEIQEALNCGHNKGVRLLAELDVGSGIGLIERIKQGQGNPTKIYVKRFTARPIPPPAPYAADHRRLPEIGTPDFPKEEVKTSENGKPRLPDNGSADFRKPEVFYNRNRMICLDFFFAEALFDNRFSLAEHHSEALAECAFQTGINFDRDSLFYFLFPDCRFCFQRRLF